jgi:hypothetical protein
MNVAIVAGLYFARPLIAPFETDLIPSERIYIE